MPCCVYGLLHGTGCTSPVDLQLNQGNITPLIPALGILFIALKLLGYIAWSWWWVLLPIYGAPVLLLVVFLLTMFGIAGYEVKTKRRR
ncbi:two-transmembrane helix containing protein [Aeromonas phage vB_AspA_Bolek]|nr:two-transmembrane helix containing protein [Aeromonas phage vB_AspA_Bolek]